MGLISKEDVLKRIEYHQNNKVINRIKTTYAFEMLKSDIEEIEEIVRCKDCKWAKKEEDEGEGNLTCACHIPRFIVPSDGFCYLGERKNDGI